MLIFASGVKHAQHIQRVLQEKHGVECGFVCGETPADERDELLARFRGEPSDGLFERRAAQVPGQRQRADHRFRRPEHRLRGDAAADHVAGALLPDGRSRLPSASGQAELPGAGLRRQCLRHGPVDQIHVRETAAGGKAARRRPRSAPSASR